MKFSGAAPGTGLEGALYAGLERLTGDLLGREWRREDGAALRIERCLIDANWGASTDVVYPCDGAFEDYAYWKHGMWSLLLELDSGSASDLQAASRGRSSAYRPGSPIPRW